MRNSNTTGFLFSSPPTHTYPRRPRLAIMDAMSYAHEQQPGRFSRPGIRIHPAGKCSRIGAGVKEDRGSSAPWLAHRQQRWKGVQCASPSNNTESRRGRENRGLSTGSCQKNNRKWCLQEGGVKVDSGIVWTRAGRSWNEKAPIYCNKVLYNDCLLESLTLSSQQFVPPVTGWAYLQWQFGSEALPPSLLAHLSPYPVFTVSTNPPALPLFADSAFWSKGVW